MKTTREQLKEIIQEELSSFLGERFEPEPYTVGSLRELAAKGDPEKEVQIKHRYAADPFDIYEALIGDDGQLIITVQERER